MFDKPIEDKNGKEEVKSAFEEENEIEEVSEESTQPDETLYTLTYNKKEVKMPLSELIVNAQKGLNYDKIKERLDLITSGKDKQNDDFLRFAQAHPEIDKLPKEVIDSLNQGKDIFEAYNEYEINTLKEELYALKQNAKNINANAGSLSDTSGSVITDSFLQEFLKG